METAVCLLAALLVVLVAGVCVLATRWKSKHPGRGLFREFFGKDLPEADEDDMIGRTEPNQEPPDSPHAPFLTDLPQGFHSGQEDAATGSESNNYSQVLDALAARGFDVSKLSGKSVEELEAILNS